MKKFEKRIVVGPNKPLWWDDPTFTHYRIENDFSDPLHSFQRHVWIREDGSEMVEEWIRAVG